MIPLRINEQHKMLLLKMIHQCGRNKETHIYLKTGKVAVHCANFSFV